MRNSLMFYVTFLNFTHWVKRFSKIEKRKKIQKIKCFQRLVGPHVSLNHLKMNVTYSIHYTPSYRSSKNYLGDEGWITPLKNSQPFLIERKSKVGKGRMNCKGNNLRKKGIMSLLISIDMKLFNSMHVIRMHTRNTLEFVNMEFTFYSFILDHLI